MFVKQNWNCIFECSGLVLESDGAGVQAASGGGSGVVGVGQGAGGGVEVGVVQQSSNNITQVNFGTIFTKKRTIIEISPLFLA